MKNTAWILGLAGLLPFIGLPALATTGVIPWHRALDGFTAYSAIILSFLGGIHWYDAICSRQKKHQIYIAMLPSLFGWFALFIISGLFSLAFLSIGFLLIMLYDKLALTLPKDDVIWYTKLRMTLTTVVVSCHTWLIFALS